MILIASCCLIMPSRSVFAEEIALSDPQVYSVYDENFDLLFQYLVADIGNSNDHTPAQQHTAQCGKA